MYAKYQISISYGSKLIGKFAIDNRHMNTVKANKMTDNLLPVNINQF